MRAELKEEVVSPVSSRMNEHGWASSVHSAAFLQQLGQSKCGGKGQSPSEESPSSKPALLWLTILQLAER